LVARSAYHRAGHSSIGRKSATRLSDESDAKTRDRSWRSLLSYYVRGPLDAGDAGVERALWGSMPETGAVL